MLTGPSAMGKSLNIEHHEGLVGTNSIDFPLKSMNIPYKLDPPPQRGLEGENPSFSVSRGFEDREERRKKNQQTN